MLAARRGVARSAGFAKYIVPSSIASRGAAVPRRRRSSLRKPARAPLRVTVLETGSKWSVCRPFRLCAPEFAPVGAPSPSEPPRSEGLSDRPPLRLRSRSSQIGRRVSASGGRFAGPGRVKVRVPLDAGEDLDSKAPTRLEKWLEP